MTGEQDSADAAATPALRSPKQKAPRGAGPEAASRPTEQV